MDRDSINIHLPLNGDLVDSHVFVATRPCEVIAVRETHGATSTSGTLQIRKSTGTQAPTAGAAVLASALDLSAAVAANTSTAGTLSTTAADLKLAAGDKLSFDFGGTLTGGTGVVVTVEIRYI
jgi:hypothetical protein